MAKKRFSTRFFCRWVLLLSAIPWLVGLLVPVAADEGTGRDRVVLVDGSELYGAVLWASEGQLAIRTGFGGTLMGKSDRFLTDVSYWGAALYLESDQFADLDQRVFLGGYFGRQWFAQPRFSLTTEPGVAYVAEEFLVAPEKEYFSGTWNIDASSNVLGKRTRLYFDQVGVWNLEATSDLVLNSRVGFSIPLIRKVEAAAEIKLEFDSRAPEGIDELDQTYEIRIGYRW